MLRINKLADYATVIMHSLVTESLGILSANQISQRIDLSLPMVSKVLKILSEAGLVVSIRGASGGYRLAKPAQDITIASIISAVEGGVAITECSGTRHVCRQESMCAIKHNWKTINRFLLNTLESVSLADMAKPLTLREIPFGDLLRTNG
jgi:FeS assembly SUF system regulator